MVFKTDKNFVTKVALRGFAPPQLLRQFCRWQNRFCGLTHCYVDARTGARGLRNKFMLLSEDEFKSTLSSEGFLDVTEIAENFDEKNFDEYVNNNLNNELGNIHIDYVYDAKDGSFRHVIFTTRLKNVHYMVVINLKNKIILGHYILNLNKEYGISEK